MFASLRLNGPVLLAALAWLAVARSFAAAPSASPSVGKPPLIAGADISMLTELERAGRVYLDEQGKPEDAIRQLVRHGVSHFRLRLFVNPDPSFAKTHGATQDLAQVQALAKRIHEAGGAWLLDLHYSDTWADPKHQTKPAAWSELPFDELCERVRSYTKETLEALNRAGVPPAQVQVGNEITSGMLWPDGRIGAATGRDRPKEWSRLAALLAAGIEGVRTAERAPTQAVPLVMLHIHGGGKENVPAWFFGSLLPALRAAGAEFDAAALSFYPAWGDSLDTLAKNIAYLRQQGKAVWIAETSYPWFESEQLDAKAAQAMRWPSTKDGQVSFVRDLRKTLTESGAAGTYWWYPEAVDTPPLHIWRAGAEALWDKEGKPLPALAVWGGAESGSEK